MRDTQGADPVWMGKEMTREVNSMRNGFRRFEDVSLYLIHYAWFYWRHREILPCPYLDAGEGERTFTTCPTQTFASRGRRNRTTLIPVLYTQMRGRDDEAFWQFNLPESNFCQPGRQSGPREYVYA